jgi:cellulose synthase/poly-beta-1,6-N-acetylglucosamine synthase-like glycosyltransferase
MIELYFKIYVFLILFYLWYRFTLRFISDLKNKKEYPEVKAKTSVIVPIYNEKPDILKLCVESLCNAEGNNEIILIDDGSTDNSWKKIKELKKEFPEIKTIKLKENKGKRYAQYVAFHYSTGKFFITVDSDTIVKRDALVELIKPFSNPKVGATTGNVRAFNRNYNFLTKMINARYMNAFGFERQALSSFGVVTCCSGALAAYRKDMILELKEKYISQKFLGKECTYGDDRHLTNLILKEGFRAEYVKKAIVYTDVPKTLKTFIKQQTRWKKSFIRESLITLKYSFNRNKLLFFETLYTSIIPPISLAARLFMIYIIIKEPIFIIPIAISISVIALIRNMLLFFEEGRKALYSIPYAFLHEIVMYWLFWIALFSLGKTKWGTR